MPFYLNRQPSAHIRTNSTMKRGRVRLSVPPANYRSSIQPRSMRVVLAGRASRIRFKETSRRNAISNLSYPEQNIIADGAVDIRDTCSRMVPNRQESAGVIMEFVLISFLRTSLFLSCVRSIFLYQQHLRNLMAIRSNGWVNFHLKTVRSA